MPTLPSYRSKQIIKWSRLAQVLALTHEDSSFTEQLPYLAARLAPIQVLECFGRAAKREPPCKTEECVFYWWKEPGVFHMTPT